MAQWRWFRLGRGVALALSAGLAASCGDDTETEACVLEEGSDSVCPITDNERAEIADRCEELCATRSDLVTSSCTFDVATCQTECEDAAGPCPGKTVPWLECRIEKSVASTCACEDGAELDCTDADENGECADLENELSFCGG